MAWRQLGDKPLSEPMMVCLLTHLCVTRPQWVNCVIFKHIPVIDIFNIAGEIAFRSMSQDLIIGNSSV